MDNPNETANNLVHGIKNRDIASIGRSITYIESNRPLHKRIANALIEECLAIKTESIRIGITGVPGVGKSTFIEQFGKMLTGLGKKVAVLAIDPSSTITKGSILGDKTRMQELVKDKNAFIRPSASGSTLGGVARNTRESIIVLEAAGYNVIIIETMGVGQSEVAVHSMVDFFLLLKLAGAGDELQGIKRGIMEMADAIAINKADGDNIEKAQMAAVEFKRALHMFPPKENGWMPTATYCSAIANTGLDIVWDSIISFVTKTKKSGHFQQNRQLQNESWLLQYLEQKLILEFYENPKIRARLADLKIQVLQGNKSPFAVAEELLAFYKNL